MISIPAWVEFYILWSNVFTVITLFSNSSLLFFTCRLMLGHILILGATINLLLFVHWAVQLISEVKRTQTQIRPPTHQLTTLLGTDRDVVLMHQVLTFLMTWPI